MGRDFFPWLGSFRFHFGSSQFGISFSALPLGKFGFRGFPSLKGNFGEKKIAFFFLSSSFKNVFSNFQPSEASFGGSLKTETQEISRQGWKGKELMVGGC